MGNYCTSNCACDGKDGEIAEFNMDVSSPSINFAESTKPGQKVQPEQLARYVFKR
jgi:hypothetical protein